MKSGRDLATVFLASVLGMLAIAYSTLGFYCLTAHISFSYPCDLRLRWVEERLVLRGLNPQEYGHPDSDPQASKYNEGMKYLGPGYPPWSYAFNMILVPPLNWTFTRWYYAAINLLAVAAIGWWAYRLGGNDGNLYSVLGVASVFAGFPYAVCLSYGQFAILILFFVVCYHVALENDNHWLAGLFLAMAFVKPNLAALLAIPPLVRREVRPVLVVIVAIAAASCTTCWLVRCDFLSMLRSFSKEVRGFAFLSQNPLVHLAQQAFGFHTGTMVASVAGGLLALLLCISRRADRSYVNVFSICIIISMFWSYRRHYDCVLLAIPLVGLLSQAIRSRSRVLTVLYVAFGASLWTPLRDPQWTLPAVQCIQTAIWIAALVALSRAPTEYVVTWHEHPMVHDVYDGLRPRPSS